ncbi:MAG: hypothetical protein AABM30_02475 [Actinomycetota bacterium]
MRGVLPVLLALVFVTGAAAAPPRAGVLVPGKSLGGLALGATPAQVLAAWGARFGTCRDCRRKTWYFNLRPFEPQGAGVTFRRGRVVALFTVWSPPGWRTDRGLRIDDPAARISGLYGPLLRTNCGTYAVLTLARGRTRTSFYVVDERVWGLGLSRSGERTCR